MQITYTVTAAWVFKVDMHSLFSRKRHLSYNLFDIEGCKTFEVTSRRYFLGTSP